MFSILTYFVYTDVKSKDPTVDLLVVYFETVKGYVDSVLTL